MPAIGRLRYLEAVPTGFDGDRGERQAASAGTLVLIHAFPLDAHMWEQQLSLCDRGWRVVAPHLRGFGDGSGDPPAASMDEYAADIVDLLDLLKVDKAVIGGLSLGGYVTLAVLRLAPRYFRGMVLADTRPQADTPEGLESRRRMVHLVQTVGPQAVVDEMLPKLLAQTTRRGRPDVVEQVRALGLSSSAAAIEGAIRAMMSRPDSTPLLESIRCPTLVLVGAEDALTPPAVSEAMQRAIPGAELAVIPGAGHLSNMEEPEGFNAALARFLEKRV